MLFSILDTVVPVYADAATSRSTLQRAREQRSAVQLCPISRRDLQGHGDHQDQARAAPKPRLAQLSAAADVEALQRPRQRAADRRAFAEAERRSTRPRCPTSPVFPRTKLTLIVAVAARPGARARRGAAAREPDHEDRDGGGAGRGHGRARSTPRSRPRRRILKLHAPEDLASQPRLRVVAEALRDLRTNLLFTDESIRSIVVTSPDGSHGKTTVAFGLAATLARAGDEDAARRRRPPPRPRRRAARTCSARRG